MDISSEVAIVVPAYNEEKNIATVIKEIEKACPNYKIIVVDDESTDKTPMIVRELSKKNHNITLLSHPFNIGGGAAVQTGVKLAYLKGYDYTVQVDADGQHNPNEVRKLLKPILEGEADLVIGSRFLERASYKTSIIRSLGIRFYSKLASFLTKQRITDVNSGFRANNRDVIAYMTENYQSRHATFKATIEMGRRGYRIKEVSVQMRLRRYGKSEFTIKRFVLFPLKMIISLIRVLWPSSRR